MFRLSGLKSYALIIVLLTGALAAGCRNQSRRESPISFSGSTMGTAYSVKIAPSSPIGSLEKLSGDIKAVLSKINDLMSTYSADSEISRFNRLDKTEWFAVSPATLKIVSEALRIGELSDGAFDITVGALVNLWGFGAKAVPDKIPDQKKIKELLRSAGYKKIKARDNPPSILKTNPAVALDFAAIAKGFAVDQAALSLEKKGINNFLVEVGGEIKARGFKSPGQPWLIAIERPAPNARAIHKVLALKNKAVATSGDYRNYYEKDGRRFSHTINPKTGRPVAHNLASVSVIDDSCMRADAWATALMTLGPEAGFKLALKQNLTAYFIIRIPGGFEEQMTPGFKTLLAEN